MGVYIIVRNGNYTSLSHHGVKGMKWGVRHDTRVATGLTKKNKIKKNASSYSNKYDIWQKKARLC